MYESSSPRTKEGKEPEVQILETLRYINQAEYTQTGGVGVDFVHVLDEMIWFASTV